jgi:hypothetical protein
MPNQFRTFVFEFEQTKYQIKGMKPRSQFCSEIILQYFPAVVGHLIYDNIESRRVVHFINKFRSKIRHHLNALLSPNISSLQDFSTSLGAPEWVLNRNIVEHAYRRLNFTSIKTSPNHLTTLLRLSAWKNEINLIGASLDPKLHNIQDLVNFGQNSIFEMSNGFIPNYLLKYPLFDTSVPYAINFAGIGYIMFQQAMYDITLTNPSYTNANNLTTFIDLFKVTTLLQDNNKGAFLDTKHVVLPEFEDFSQIQTLLIWFVKTWTCEMERENLNYHSKAHYIRQKLIGEASSMFKTHFNCGSFIFRDRPHFNIGHFLNKDGI